MEFKKSNIKNKKYSVITPKGKKIHFGDKRYEQYEDKVLGIYSKLNHFDKERRKNYLKRSKGIVDKFGNKTFNNKEKPNYYSIKYLW